MVDVGALSASVSSTAFAIILSTRCSNIFSDIVKSEIHSQDFAFVGSQLGLGIITYVAYFLAFERWQSWSDEV